MIEVSCQVFSLVLALQGRTDDISRYNTSLMLSERLFYFYFLSEVSEKVGVGVYTSSFKVPHILTAD